MDWSRFLTYLLVMAGVTYLIRMLPLAAVRGRIRSRFLQSFLHYVPYAVLGAMTFPAVLGSTGHLAGSLCGLAAALLFLLEIFERRTGWFDARRRPRAKEAASAAPLAPARGREVTVTEAGNAPAAPLPSPAATNAPAAPPESPLVRAKRRARERTHQR